MVLPIHEPDGGSTSLDQLTAIASAMESQMVRLYTGLADEMTRQRLEAVAATFRTLAAVEQGHVGEVAAWSRSVTGAPVAVSPEAEATVWSRIALPAGEEAAAAPMTHHRAFSIAIRAEERAFGFYTYVMVRARHPEVRVHAETLARQELEHAALLRIERRKAYRRDRAKVRDGALTVPVISDAAAHEALAAVWEGQVAATLDGLRRKLQADRADTVTTSLLESLAAQWRDDAERRALRADDARPDAEAVRSMAETLSPPALSGSARDGLAMAARVLERLYDAYEAIAERSPAEAVMVAAVASAESVLSDLTLVYERRLALEAAGPAP